MNTPVRAKGSPRAAGNQRAAVPAALLCLLLTACGGPDRPVGVVGHVDGFAGFVAADEPRAALLGRDILSAGGTPADAAVAMAFALSVTLPSQAGLGAGGSCLIYDHDKGRVRALTFVAPPPSRLQAGTTRPTAVPELPRAMYALHDRYGRMRWESLVTPAENMARFGVSTSRAFALQLQPFATALLQDPASSAVFGGGEGTGVREGDLLTQNDLGATLARLRVEGVGNLYTDQGADALAAAAAAAGGSLNKADLAATQPRWSDPLAVVTGNDTAYFAPAPAAAGMVEAQMWGILAGQGRYGDAPAASRAQLMAETSARVFADRQVWMNPEGTSNQADAALLSTAHLNGLMAGYSASGHQAAGGNPVTDAPAGTGLVVVGKDGSAISCAFSMNNSFGTGRMLPNMGFYLPFAPGIKGRGPYSLGPVLVLNHNSNEFRFAAAAGGGPGAADAVIEPMAAAQLEHVPLDQALAAKRVYAPNAPDQVVAEPGAPQAAALRAAGHQVEEGGLNVRVNAVQCGSGDPRPSRCSAETDPRGAGMAMVVGKD